MGAFETPVVHSGFRNRVSESAPVQSRFKDINRTHLDGFISQGDAARFGAETPYTCGFNCLSQEAEFMLGTPGWRAKMRLRHHDAEVSFFDVL